MNITDIKKGDLVRFLPGNEKYIYKVETIELDTAYLNDWRDGSSFTALREEMELIKEETQ